MQDKKIKLMIEAFIYLKSMDTHLKKIDKNVKEILDYLKEYDTYEWINVFYGEHGIYIYDSYFYFFYVCVVKNVWKNKSGTTKI